MTFIENTAIYGTSISELIFEGAIPPTLGGINWTNTKNQMTIYYPECFSGNWLS
ncbi:MAG: hypothetical protein LBG59_04365 [Candidatus Peribacteria bacterium]|nr:hypothetical protein [Candidatus Peribacteria bacterium]